MINRLLPNPFTTEGFAPLLLMFSYILNLCGETHDATLALNGEEQKILTVCIL